MEVLVEYDYSAQNLDELTIKKGDKIRNVIRKEDGWFEGELISNGKRGVFPDNFVKPIKNTPVSKPIIFNSPDDKKKSFITQTPIVAPIVVPPPQPPTSVASNQFQAKVLYSYVPVNDDELSIQENEIVTVIRLVEDGWYEGVLNGKRGVFPSNYVEKIEKLDKQDDEFETKKKKVFGIGFGNIFSGKQIELKTKENFAPVDIEPAIRKIKAKVLFDYEPSQPDELKLTRNEIIYILDRNLDDEGWWKGEIITSGKIGVFPDNFVQIIDEEKSKKFIETSNLNSAGSSTSSAASSSNNSLQRESKITSPSFDEIGQESERLTHLKKTRPVHRRPPSFRTKTLTKEDSIEVESKPIVSQSVLISSVTSSKEMQSSSSLAQMRESVVQDDLVQLRQEIEAIKQSNHEVVGEYRKVQNELVEVRKQHEEQMKKMQKKLNDLIFEIDEEKKTRLGLQVELERLKKTIMLNS
ncbi:unnamed protein product [Brachionus calyciflorus]|uniref:SH3 domain-containing protein n=1 Tax=Brachionus calyciflorus TaxID=104777 RepID=A0A814AIU6_9BILA|nr:unnamed protein product [Brachionus calyciflorus]